MLRLLTFTNLYPSVHNPRHGIFVEQRLRRLVESGRVSARVLVPLPRGAFEQAAVPAAVERFGIPVEYAPFRAVHGVTTAVNPLLMALAARRALHRHGPQAADFDVLDAHFLYPDGVAAVLLGGWLGKPVVLTARGSDVNVALAERLAGGCIRWAARRAAALVAVSATLRDAMVAGGLPADRIQVARNGVDLETFRPPPGAAARAPGGPRLLSVGNLVAEKGHALTLEALAALSDASLVVIGSGPEGDRLRALARALGVADRVTWLATVPQAELAVHYAAADLTVLASTREGMPNVLLESLACGTPVVATAVGGATEIVTDPVAGRLVGERSAAAFATACRELLVAPPDAAATRRFAERFGWAAPVASLLALLTQVAASSELRSAGPRRVLL